MAPRWLRFQSGPCSVSQGASLRTCIWQTSGRRCVHALSQPFGEVGHPGQTGQSPRNADSQRRSFSLCRVRLGARSARARTDPCRRVEQRVSPCGDRRGAWRVAEKGDLAEALTATKGRATSRKIRTESQSAILPTGCARWCAPLLSGECIQVPPFATFYSWQRLAKSTTSGRRRRRRRSVGRTVRGGSVRGRR